jgi:GH25 family lysozyme M1 (1,4-beta-N-acetylmuramidase)
MSRLRWYLDRLVQTISPTELIDGQDHARYQNEAQSNRIIPYNLIRDAGYEFVVIKASEASSTDPYWTQNWQGAVAAGLKVCAYHFFRSNVAGATQANYFLNATAAFRAAVSYRPVLFLDVETEDGVTASTRTNRLIAAITTLLGVPVQPGVYSSPGFWNYNIVHSTIAPYLPECWQWVAHWTSASAPQRPTGWSAERMKFWQRGISGRDSWVPPVPPGMAGRVDYDIFMGTGEELNAVLGIVEPTHEEQHQLLWSWYEETH